jgi:hypothetical protein
MTQNCAVEDPASSLLERRWFAAGRAAAAIRAECDALARVREMAEDAWRNALAQLSNLEALRDALGDQLSAGDSADARSPPVSSERSAAA